MIHIGGLMRFTFIMPQVSVIIPNYNHSKYLVQRIESVLNQSYQNFEVILMDDCSTDSSRDVLQQYAKHPKVSHTIYNDQNSGNTFKQWKKGIELAKGKYIWIAESDDWCEPALLQTLVDGITSDDECVISYCQSFFADENGKVNSNSSHWKSSEIIDGHLYIQKHLSVPVALFNASMALWKKSAFATIQDDIDQFKLCGDWYFWIQLSKTGKVFISGEVLNYFRQHQITVSKTAYKTGLNFVEELAVIDLLYKDSLITEKGYYKAYKKKFIEFWAKRGKIDPENRKVIEHLFRNPLSSKVSLFKLIPSAIFKQIKNFSSKKTRS